jgi:hypothetical protein
MYNWYLLSLQSFNMHTAQVTIYSVHSTPLANPTPTYLAPSSCDRNVHLSPRLLVNCPLFVPHCSHVPLPSQLPSPLGFPRTQCAFN